VRGDLDLDAVWMRYPRHIALYAKALRVEGSLYLRKAHIEGTVYLVEAQISADLRAQGLSISSVPGGHAFVASPVRIGGETVLDDTEVSEEADLDFRASRLGGNLSLRKVRAKRVELPKVQVQGSLDVSGARITDLDASEMILRGDLSMEEGTAELYLGAAQVEGNISLQSVRGDVNAEGLTLKGTLKVEFANLGTPVYYGSPSRGKYGAQRSKFRRINIRGEAGLRGRSKAHGSPMLVRTRPKL
jgi:hypothetical protein